MLPMQTEHLNLGPAVKTIIATATLARASVERFLSCPHSPRPMVGTNLAWVVPEILACPGS